MKSDVLLHVNFMFLLISDTEVRKQEMRKTNRRKGKNDGDRRLRISTEIKNIEETILSEKDKHRNIDRKEKNTMSKWENERQKFHYKSQKRGKEKLKVILKNVRKLIKFRILKGEKLEKE